MIHPTQSTSTDGVGANVSAPPGQRIVVSPRVGGGVYAAYVIGFPPTKVALWQLGPYNAINRSAGGDVERVGTAAGPGGRVWLYWWNASSAKIEVARTNPAATVLGSSCAISTPGAATDVWDLVGNASQGPLQLLTLAGSSHPSVYGTVVNPCLTVVAKPTAPP